MATASRVLVVTSLALLVACGSKKSKPGEGGEDSADGRLVVDGQGVHLFGERLTGAPADKLERVEPLFQALKQSRENFKMKTPAADPPRALTVELPPDTTCLAGMSVLYSAAYGSRTELRVSVGGVTREVTMHLPPPPGASLSESPGLRPRLAFAKDGRIGVAKHACQRDYDQVEVGQLAATVGELAGTSEVERILVECEPGVPLSQVLAAYEATSKVAPPAKKPFAMSPLACVKSKESSPFASASDFTAGGDPDAPSAPWGREDGMDAPLEYDDEKIVSVPDPPKGRLLGNGHKWKPAVTKIGEVTLDPNATGGLTAEAVTKGIEASLQYVSSCYQQGLVNNPNLAGRVKLAFEVGKTGFVFSVSATGDLPDRGVVDCIARAASKKVTITPAPQKLARVSVTLGFTPDG